MYISKYFNIFQYINELTTSIAVTLLGHLMRRVNKRRGHVYIPDVSSIAHVGGRYASCILSTHSYLLRVRVKD